MRKTCWFTQILWTVERMLYFIIIMNLLQEHLHFWSKHFRCLMLIMQNHHDRVVQLSLTLPGAKPRIAHSSLERKQRSACWLKLAQSKSVLPFGKGLPVIKSLTVPQTSWIWFCWIEWFKVDSRVWVVLICLSPSWMLDWFLEKWSMTMQMSILFCSQVFTTLTSSLISLTHTEEWWDDVFLIRSYSFSEQQKKENFLSLLVCLQALIRTMCLYWAWGDTMCSDVFTWYLKLEGGASFWALCSNLLIFVSILKKRSE